MTCIVQAQWAAAAAAEVYTNGEASRVARIDKFEARNNDTAQRTFNVHLVPNGGAVGNENLRLTTEIQPKETLELLEIVGHDINPGDSLHVFSDVADKVSFRVSARLVAL